MSVIDATIRVTADWLCETSKPVVYTGRTKDQPLMADPFPIFQQVVKAFPDFFKEEYGYVPDPSSKTGLAGVRSKVYTEIWRDYVILPALRIYRARMEGASLDTVPEVTYSVKPSCDGRADKSIAQRGIMGFEPAQARKGYVYNPERNPNLLDMPAELPVDRKICAALWDKEADLRNGALESAYFTALNITVAAPTVTAWKRPRKQYMCSHCAGVPKKGHICPVKVAKNTGKKPPKRKSSTVRAAVKKARK